MPMSRYQIRNEYSLSDPELFRGADKDDPEALLEGVAMAGLVGVLRQLGDLAEFAAEIFHDLHEEVMVTAARGHDLMVRVQELEAEVPSIERAFLFQTDHSCFFYNPGVDWHPNFRENKNNVVFGDMPRFIMNSYEDCRGPPRLFLLDKYDIGGAGACLKRYTDPGFFKVEASLRSSADGMLINKGRRAKKRGTHPKNEDAAVALMRSNPKLHQLFLEEPIVKTVNKPARVKLKRRLNGFPFDTKSGKSYMEKLFANPMEHEMSNGVSRNSSLWLPSNGHSEPDPDIHEVRSISPVRKSTRRIKVNPHPDDSGTMQSELLCGKNGVPTDKRCQEHNSYTSVDEGSETDIHVDGERNLGSSLIRRSFEISSEIDDHPEAPSAREMEEKMDFDLRLKNDWTSTFFERQISVSNYENFHFQPSDSLATTSSATFKEESSATKYEHSFVSSYGNGTSARIPLAERKDEIPLDIIDKASSADHRVESSVSLGDERNSSIPNKNGHSAEQLNSVPLRNDLQYSLLDSDSEEVSGEAQSRGYISNEIAALQYNAKETVNALGLPSLRKSCVLNESNSVNSSSASMVSEYNSVSSSQSIHEDSCDQEVVKPMKSYLSNTCDVHQNVDSEEVVPHNISGVEFADGFQERSVSVPYNYTGAYAGNSTPLMISTREKQENESDADGLNVVSASQDFLPFVMDVSNGKSPMESYSPQEYGISHDKLIDSEIVAATVNHNRPDPYDDQDGHSVIGNNFLESPFFSGSEKSQSSGASDDILISNAEIPVLVVTDTDKVNSSATGFETNHNSGPVDVKILNDFCSLEASDSKTGKQIASPAHKIDDYSLRNDTMLPHEPAELIEKPVSRVADFGRDDFADDYSYHKNKHAEDSSEIASTSGEDHADAVSGVGQYERTAATEDISGFFYSKSNFRNPASIESPSFLDSEVGKPSGLVEDTSSMQPRQHCLLDEAQNPSLQSDQQTSHPLCVYEETVAEERRSATEATEENIFFSSESHGSTLVLQNQGRVINDVSGYLNETSSSTSPFSREDQLTLGETPPLPPLPPFKWRMGKLSQFSSVGTDLESESRPFPTEIAMPSLSGEARLLAEDINFTSLHSHDTSLNAEPRSPALDSSRVHTAFHHQPEVVNHKNVIPTEISISDASSAASKLESINRSSSMYEASSTPAIDLIPEREIKQHHSSVAVRDVVNHEELVASEIVPHAAFKEDRFNQSSSTSSPSSIPAISMAGETETKEQQKSSVVVREAVSYEELVPVSTSVHAAPSDGAVSIEKISSFMTQDASGMKFKESSSVETDLDKESCPEVSMPADSIDAKSKMNSSETSLISEIKSKEEKPEKVSSVAESDSIPVHPLPLMESNKPKLSSVASDVDEIKSEEGRITKEIPKVKLPKPHNPLIDAVSALDRSKLRKVVQQERPPAHSVNERDSLLEQIRTKSFNLKPAMGSRPRVEAPRTNLKVSAILEKANAIRQALADSDEENWSDS